MTMIVVFLAGVVTGAAGIVGLFFLLIKGDTGLNRTEFQFLPPSRTDDSVGGPTAAQIKQSQSRLPESGQPD